jgi:hypothetical protein
MAEGGTTKNQLETLEKQIEEELQEWSKAGLDVGNVNCITFIMNARIIALFDILEELADISVDKMTLLYNKVLLKELKETRAKIEPEFSQAKKQFLEQQLAPTPEERGKIIGLDGKPLKLQ